MLAMQYRPGPHLLAAAVAAVFLAGCATAVPAPGGQGTPQGTP